MEHIIGSFLVIMFIHELLKQTKIITYIPFNLQLVVLIGLTNLLGVVNEIVELAIDFSFQAQSIGPELWDTNIDLLMNFLGMGLYCFALLLRHRNPTNKTTSS
jgi:hypothetical protein